MATVTLAVEGATDAAVLRRVLSHLGHSVAVVHGGYGKSGINRNIAGYNNAARFAPWLVLRDLDYDATCPSALSAALLPAPAIHMRLRIAVREVESWLIADRAALAEFLSISIQRIPSDPDALEQPKRTLVELARGSRRKAIRDDMVPAEGSSGLVGPAYTSRLDEFAGGSWRPAVAAKQSRSLRRSLDRLAASWIGLP